MSGSMPDSPEDVTRFALIARGLGTRPSTAGVWPIYAEYLPDGEGVPDNLICVYGSKPKMQGRIQATGEMQLHFGIQILLRVLNPSAGKTLMNTIQQDLDTFFNNTQVTHPISTHVYLIHAFTRTTGVLSLGKESPNSQRSLFSINALASIRLVS